MNSKSKPIRVLHITEMLSAAGIESFFMNVYRKIDRTKVQFDFLVLRDQHEFYEDEVNNLGGKKYWVHSNKNNTLLRIVEEGKMIQDFLQKHPYDIVHIHYTTPLRAIYLKNLKNAGVSTRIYHAHSAFVSGKNIVKHMIYAYMRKMITKYATDYFACSEAAGEWIFEKKLVSSGTVQVIYNGLEIDRYTFDENKREAIRNELNIGNKYVLVHTGRFTEQKNQMFLVKVFNELHKKNKDTFLLLLGDGPLKGVVEEMVKELDIDKAVLFLGVKNNVQDYLFAADCYVMPSLYEGLPVAGVEAQCAGLPCVFSDNITREVGLIKETVFLSLNQPIEKWCEQILELEGHRNYNAHNEIRKSGYDMSDVANRLQDFYLKRVK